MNAWMDEFRALSLSLSLYAYMTQVLCWKGKGGKKGHFYAYTDSSRLLLLHHHHSFFSLLLSLHIYMVYIINTLNSPSLYGQIDRQIPTPPFLLLLLVSINVRKYVLCMYACNQIYVCIYIYVFLSTYPTGVVLGLIHGQIDKKTPIHPPQSPYLSIHPIHPSEAPCID